LYHANLIQITCVYKYDKNKTSILIKLIRSKQVGLFKHRLCVNIYRCRWSFICWPHTAHTRTLISSSLLWLSFSEVWLSFSEQILGYHSLGYHNLQIIEEQQLSIMYIRV